MRIYNIGANGPDVEGPGKKRETGTSGRQDKPLDSAHFSVDALALFEEAREYRLAGVRRKIAEGAYDRPEVRERVARAIIQESGG